jgi:hypothetical protein
VFNEQIVRYCASVQRVQNNIFVTKLSAESVQANSCELTKLTCYPFRVCARV